ncbi:MULTISPECIES: type I toxin-antitoxin system Fst family toxin [unclassified Streptococcus]|nr:MULTISPECIES: type I toxin-antitoxin system Fst family toxin [unclassified Streptococcus]DAT21188.1 MAG TPA: toxin [Caudoviricetes sp.]
MELLFTLILAPLLVNLATKLISDWLDSKQDKDKR